MITGHLEGNSARSSAIILSFAFEADRRIFFYRSRQLFVFSYRALSFFVFWKLFLDLLTWMAERLVSCGVVVVKPVTCNFCNIASHSTCVYQTGHPVQHGQLADCRKTASTLQSSVDPSVINTLR